ncbi:MAG: hypothetical protein MUO23_15140, partial [Anaerolineales bacterium]|nr:hypothetical protein [Anaerolineales bacterium]
RQAMPRVRRRSHDRAGERFAIRLAHPALEAGLGRKGVVSLRRTGTMTEVAPFWWTVGGLGDTHAARV